MVCTGFEFAIENKCAGVERKSSEIERQSRRMILQLLRKDYFRNNRF